METVVGEVVVVRVRRARASTVGPALALDAAAASGAWLALATPGASPPPPQALSAAQVATSATRRLSMVGLGRLWLAEVADPVGFGQGGAVAAAGRAGWEARREEGGNARRLGMVRARCDEGLRTRKSPPMSGCEKS